MHIHQLSTIRAIYILHTTHDDQHAALATAKCLGHISCSNDRFGIHKFSTRCSVANPDFSRTRGEISGGVVVCDVVRPAAHTTLFPPRWARAFKLCIYMGQILSIYEARKKNKTQTTTRNMHRTTQYRQSLFSPSIPCTKPVRELDGKRQCIAQW